MEHQIPLWLFSRVCMMYFMFGLAPYNQMVCEKCRVYGVVSLFMEAKCPIKCGWEARCQRNFRYIFNAKSLLTKIYHRFYSCDINAQKRNIALREIFCFHEWIPVCSTNWIYHIGLYNKLFSHINTSVSRQHKVIINQYESCPLLQVQMNSFPMIIEST